MSGRPGTSSEERLARLEALVENHVMSALDEIQDRIKTLDSRLWWILGSVVLAIVGSVIVRVLGL